MKHFKKLDRKVLDFYMVTGFWHTCKLCNYTFYFHENIGTISIFDFDFAQNWTLLVYTSNWYYFRPSLRTNKLHGYDIGTEI